MRRVQYIVKTPGGQITVQRTLLQAQNVARNCGGFIRTELIEEPEFTNTSTVKTSLMKKFGKQLKFR